MSDFARTSHVGVRSVRRPNASAQATRIEPRWPPALAILALLFLLEVLPGRFRLLPVWFPYFAAIVILLPIVAAALAPANALWLRVQRTTTSLFFVITATTIVGTMVDLIGTIMRRPEEFMAIPLLSSSIALWVSNIVMFSLLYWQIDRGGPDARVNDLGIKPDWLFPQAGVPGDVPPDWRPSFVDYLFLGYSTATAFSPTDALPLTSRAKLLMMIESTIALVTVLVVAARAISILK